MVAYRPPHKAGVLFHGDPQASCQSGGEHNRYPHNWTITGLAVCAMEMWLIGLLTHLKNCYNSWNKTDARKC